MFVPEEGNTAWIVYYVECAEEHCAAQIVPWVVREYCAARIVPCIEWEHCTARIVLGIDASITLLRCSTGEREKAEHVIRSWTLLQFAVCILEQSHMLE